MQKQLEYENLSLIGRVAELEAKNDENLKLLYGRDLEIERLTAALGQCSQARAELLETLRRMKE